MDSTCFTCQLAVAALKSTFSDMGTNWLGWTLIFLIPLLVVVFRKARQAPKRQRWNAVKKQWKSELRDTFALWFGVTAFVFSYELFWNQPSEIRARAAAIEPPPIVFKVPSPPVITYPGHSSQPQEQSRLVVTSVVGQPVKNAQNVRGFVLNITYANRGTIPVISMTHRTAMMLNTGEITPKQQAEAEAVMHSPNAAIPAVDGVEIEPGDTPKHYFSFPGADEQIVQMAATAQTVLDGKLRMYLFVRFKYRDRNLGKGEVRVTEFCGWFQGTFDMWHNCADNRIYTTKEP